MDCVRLGKTGLRISRIALGCMSYGDPTSTSAHLWSLDDEDAQPFFRQAVELGVTSWDTANVYQHGTSEELVGRAIKRYSRREEIVLATKVHGKMHDGPGGQGLSRKAIIEQVDASLARLGTDYIDLYQIHRFDPDAPVEETMEALHDIVKTGKVRYLGASSMFAWQFAKLQHAADLHGWTPFVAMQNQYNLLRRQDERELLAMCADMGVGAVPYSSQGKGRLARPWGEQLHRSSVDAVVKAFDSPLDEPVVNAVQRIAEVRGTSMAQVALAWVLKNPVVSAPIVGATKPHHLPDSIAALDLHLTDDEIMDLKSRTRPTGPPGSDELPPHRPSAGHGPSPCSLRSGADLTTIATNPPEPCRPHALGGHASAWAYDPHSGTESLLSGWSSTNRLVAEAEEVGFERPP